MVCPGQYAEQVMINKPVTLEGIDQGGGALVQIMPPAGYTVNAAVNVDGEIIPAVAQVYVNDVRNGSVDLTNLAVNGMGQSGLGGLFIGILYMGSSGTINQVIASSQYPPEDGTGWGMWIEGGSSNPSVTVENSDIHDFNQGGIMVTGTSDALDLIATIKNNMISNFYSQTTYNLDLEQGANETVTGNFVSGGLFGIFIVGSEGSVTGNSVSGSHIGIELGVDGLTVTSNNIYATSSVGIDVEATHLQASKVEDNTIKTVGLGGATGTGIELGCNIGSSRMHSNTLMDSYYGYGDAPAGFSGSNTYVGINYEVSTCASDGPSKASARYREKVLGKLQEQ
jgi:parallel beta-helix repeat protein